MIPGFGLADELVTLANVADPGQITADEPIADVFLAENAARYLDTSSLHWQKSRNCAACHGNMGYMFARRDFQRDDGGWNWHKDDYPPTESDEHYGVTLAALITGVAPDRYVETEEARRGLEKIRMFLKNNPPLSLHHRAMIAWASCYVSDFMYDQQRAKTLDELLTLQRPGGGWSTPGLLADWKDFKRLDGKPHDTRTSDAYATGFAIIVARELGVSSDDPRLRRGIDWLLSNQRMSGKWFCRSPAKDSRHYFSDFGSAFAILALQSCDRLPGWPL